MSTPRRVRFGRFAFDARARLLFDGEERVPLQTKVAELLQVLVDRPGDLVLREELQASLWPDVHVADGSLTKAASRLRSIIGEALRTYPGRGYKLVAQLTSDPTALFGRDGDLRNVEARLEADRLVVVTGPPGIGRTAIAQAVAGAGVLSLGPSRGLCAAAASWLGLPADADPDAVGRALTDRGDGLLAVDDLHHDPDGVALLTAWRPAAPRLRWLVTSEAPGGLGGRPPVRLGGLSDDDAVQLLVATAATPLRADDPDLRAIAAALDGNPLALVLAADRLRAMTPRDLLHRLDDRLALLATDGASLRAALDRGGARLAPRARELLATLSVVRSAMPLATAERVHGPWVHEVLSGLVDAGWVEVQQHHGTTWLYLPNNPRTWIERQPHDRTTLHTQVVAWVSEVGEERALRFRACNDPEAQEWLDGHADLVIELASTHEGPGLARLVRLASWALDRRGQMAGLVSLTRRALAIGEMDAIQRIDLLIRLGIGLRWAGRTEEALTTLAQAAAEAEANGDVSRRARAWSDHALTLLMMGLDGGPSVDRALDHAAECDAETHAGALLAAFAVGSARGEPPFELIERAAGLPLHRRSPMQCAVQAALGSILHTAGRIREAESVYRDWLAEHVGASRHQRAGSRTNLGTLLCEDGRFAEGDAEIEEALRLARSGGDAVLVSILLAFRVRACLAFGAPWKGALEQLQELGRTLATSEPATTHLRFVSGLVALRERDPLGAMARFEGIRPAVGLDRALVVACTAVALAWLGPSDQAAELAARAREVAGDGSQRLAADLADAWLAWMRGDPEWTERFAAFDRPVGPRVAPGRSRMLELRWLDPVALGIERPHGLT